MSPEDAPANSNTNRDGTPEAAARDWQNLPISGDCAGIGRWALRFDLLRAGPLRQRVIRNAALTGHLTRTLNALGLKREPIDVTPVLNEYLSTLPAET